MCNRVYTSKHRGVLELLAVAGIDATKNSRDRQRGDVTNSVPREGDEWQHTCMFMLRVEMHIKTTLQKMNKSTHG